jgi:hypothetical protein
MASSKMDRLQKQATRTGRGLFDGYVKMNAREELPESTNIITSDINDRDETTAKVNALDDSLVNEKDEKSASVMEKHPSKKQKEGPTVHTDDDTLSRRPVEPIEEGTDNREKIDVVVEEILKGVSPEDGIMTSEKADMEESKSDDEENMSASTEMLEKSSKSKDDTAVSESVKTEIKNDPKGDEKPAKKQNGRYEKDKFLLLDIRGYRDYIEHIAKAANMSATKYIRSLIEQDMEKNKEIYLAQKQLEERLRAKSGK